MSVDIGGNEFYGGTTKSGFGFEGTIRAATVEADGKAILRDGNS